MGKEELITPWWAKDPARIILGCIFLFNWPFRMSYKGRIAKHNVEVKKAVFVENTSQDEGVSLSATPGSSNAEQQAANSNPTSANNPPIHGGKEASKEAVACNSNNQGAASNNEQDDDGVDSSISTSKPPIAQKSNQQANPNIIHQGNQLAKEAIDGQNTTALTATTAEINNPEASGSVLKHNEHLVDAVISQPPHSDISHNAPFIPTQGTNPSYVQPPPYIEQRHPGSSDGYYFQQQNQQQQFYHHQQTHSAHSYSKQQTTLGPSIHNLQSIAGGSGGPSSEGHLSTSINTATNIDSYRPTHHSSLAQTHPLARALPASPPLPPQRSVPLRSPRTNLRETTKDIVTAVTHQDINGMSAVNTVALKDIDVQLSSLSGYETYV